MFTGWHHAPMNTCHELNGELFVRDAAKAALNLRKHGIFFRLKGAVSFHFLKNINITDPNVTTFPVFDSEDTATIRLCDDGTSRLLFEWFPLDNCHLTEETLTVGMAAAIGVKVLRDDRELYIIMSDAEPVIQAAIAYMKAHR
jgi:hypothetical protein